MTELALELVERLRVAQRVTVLTGSGISAESGIPTFRDAQTGLWSQYDSTQLATPQAFQRNPRLVWDWYRHRRRLIDSSAPNTAHYALVDMEQHFPTFTLITQNVDGLHWRAGSRDMLELHGNLSRSRCFECGSHADRWSDEDDDERPPRCAHCGGFLRPDVVWFGEGISSRVLERARQATQITDVFLCVGTSAVVQPAATLPLIALRGGAFVAEINTEETAVSVLAHCSLRERAGMVLPALMQAVLGQQRSQGEAL